MAADLRGSCGVSGGLLMSVLYTSIDLEMVEVPKRKQAQILREGMRRIAQNHRLVTLGKHFSKVPETQPGGAYGYVARNAKYVAKKLARFGTDDPNVRTGALKRSTRNNSVVTATQYRSQLLIKAPRAMKEQQRRELEAITPLEVLNAQGFGRTYVLKEFWNPKNRLKRKRKLT